jgi:alkylation response protein AidB-like acyl-CoA dehydrogenase
MDLEYPPETEAARADIRSWITEQLPAGWSEGVRPAGDDWFAFCRAWDAKLHLSGWSCPTWPVEYGGRGVSVVEAVMFNEEAARAGAPIQPPAGGEILVGPTILRWGTDDQKHRYLPPIARGEETWCQGFSEPDAGSDLASLQTTAVLEGDEWIVNGTKIWTSEAQDADFAFMLVRTDPDATRHRGISYFLVPMSSRGITVEPIVQIDGTGGFNRVEFDGVRCPSDAILGGVGDGWTVAMSTLGFERGTSASTSHHRFEREFDEIVADARRNGALGRASIRQRLSRLYGDIQIMRINGYRMVTAAIHSEHRDHVAGLDATTKLAWTEMHQRLTDIGIDVRGPAGQVLTGVTGGPPVVGVGMGHRPAHYDYPADPAQSRFLFARSGTIFGGTSEVQRNIIAERVLGLPREPRT